MNKYFVIIIFFCADIFVVASDWTIEQKILFQFEEMFYNNWEGTGFNYVSGSARFLGDYKTMSDDSTLKLINNVEGAIGVGYTENEKWKIQEDKISANSSVNQQIHSYWNVNGTVDLKTQFNFENAYILGAIGCSYIVGALSVQENPLTMRFAIFKNAPPEYEFGNYFKLLWKGDLDTNITLGIKLENFYQYGQIWLKESYWNMEALTTFQINKLISSHIVVNMLLDPTQSKKLQAWEKITIGFTWNL